MSNYFQISKICRPVTQSILGREPRPLDQNDLEKIMYLYLVIKIKGLL